jgi:STE24 endopeptidase
LARWDSSLFYGALITEISTLAAWVAATLILLRLTTELWLSWLNRKHVLENAGTVPPAFREVIDPPAYAKCVQYTLARGRFGRITDTFNAVVLLAILFTGVLPWAFGVLEQSLGTSVWATAACLFAIGIGMVLPGLPFDWYEQFHLEENFGFNTTTHKTWWLDRLKGFLLAALLGLPLIALILKFVDWTGDSWWLLAWAALMAFQLLMLVLGPVLILPLFNKFTPLPEGDLRARLLALAGRTNFQAENIQVMDGSKRSRHSNAFFTGFGRLRKIVLFDTLIQQLTEPELEAVLAHEIGHYKKKHIPKMLAFSALTSLVGFFVISVLAKQEWFYRGFGFDFQPGKIAPALLLFSLLSGVVMFWFSPLMHWWSRKHEYEADAFAAKVMSEARSLIGALRKLNEKNLSNLTPHPFYSGFYYSHPTMLEREAALGEISTTQTNRPV